MLSFMVHICDWAWENRAYLHKLHLWHVSPVLYTIICYPSFNEFFYDDILDMMQATNKKLLHSNSQNQVKFYV